MNMKTMKTMRTKKNAMLLSLACLIAAMCLLSGSCGGDGTQGMGSAGDMPDGSAPADSGSQQTDAQQPASQSITAADLQNMMSEGQDYTLVDVRTDSEYQAGHIEGAILIPVDVIGDQAASYLPDKNAFIVVYCRSGARSASAAAALVNLGYTNIHDLGGISNWPYGTVTGSE